MATAIVPLILRSTRATADVPMYGHDQLSTGWYNDQSTLTPGLVSSGTFGKMWSADVDGQVFAQPVTSRGTVFIATEANNIYGIDQASGTVRWQRNLGVGWNGADICGDLLPTAGVTGTPTIDPATNTAFFFNKTYASGTSGPAAWWVHGVDVATGVERAGFPTLIQGAAANDPSVTFNPTTQLQRPGLLLMDGVVYAGFGGHCDFPPYRGWVIGVSTAGQITTLWDAEAGQTSASPGAGIWQSGGSLVSDAPGEILLTTGNGIVPSTAAPGNQPPGALGQAVVRLKVQPDRSLKAVDFFIPYDADQLNSWDADLGSGPPTVLPASFGTPAVPRVGLQIGKQGYLYVLDETNLGGFRQGSGGADAVVNRLGPFGGVWGKLAPWGGDGGYVYLATVSGGNTGGGTSGFLRAFKRGVDGAGKPTFSLAGSSTDPFGYTSGSPVVSSAGTVSGSALVWIIWSADGTGKNAQLRAYDPVPVGGELRLRWSAPIGTATKFAVPIIDGDRVIIGTRDGKVMSFGSPVTSPLSALPLTIGPTTIGASSLTAAHFTANFDTDLVSLAIDDPHFQVGASSPAVPSRLLQGEQLVVPVTFSPTATGLVSAALTVTTAGGPVELAVTGTGLSAAAELSASPASVSFGSATVNGPPATATVAVRNTGAQPLTIQSVSSPAAPFSVTGLPAAGAVVPAQGEVVISVSFAPTGIGVFVDAIALVTSAGSLEIPMSATAADPPRLELSTTTVNLGDVTVGSSKTAPFTVTNTGGSTLVITRSKPPASSGFTQLEGIAEGTTVNPGSSVTGSVTFAPTTTGAATGVWQLNGNDNSGVQTVTFSANGTPQPPIRPPTAGGWQLNSFAKLSGTDLVLTEAANWQTGTAFWPYAISPADLVVNFDMTIDGGTGADGMAVVFGDPGAGATPTAEGHGGGSLGFAGIPGTAVGFDTLPTSSIGYLARSDNVDLNWLSQQAVPALRPGTHHVQVSINGTATSLIVTLDGATVLTQAVILPPRVLFGFSAATGGLNDRQAVANVRFGAPQPSALVPSGPMPTFGFVPVGSSANAVVTWTNPGDKPVVVTGTLTPPGPYRTSSIPIGMVVPPGGAIDQLMTFSPTYPGYFGGTDSVTTDLGGTRSVTVLAGGTAVSIPAPPNGGWVLNGSAQQQGTALQLTEARGSQRGSAYWPAPIATRWIDVEFDASIPEGTGADGLALSFADASSTAPTALGGFGGGLGFTGTAGAAVALDTFRNIGDPSNNFVGVSTSSTDDAPNWLATSTAISDLRTGTHHVRVLALGGFLNILIDGKPVLTSKVTLPPSVLVGFTAATGGLADRHLVDNVKITTWPPPASSSVSSPGTATWTVNGAASFAADGTANPLVLTPAQGSARGSAWSNATVASSNIHASFDVTIDQGSGADGMAFVIADAATAPTALGQGGGSLGWPGPPGVAFVFDTWRGAGDPSDNFVGIATGLTSGQPTYITTNTKIAPLRGGTHHVDVHVIGGQLRMSMDGLVVLVAGVVLPDQVRLGFTAATGGYDDRHAVSNVGISN